VADWIDGELLREAWRSNRQKQICVVGLWGEWG
jgi:hypothetical protein